VNIYRYVFIIIVSLLTNSCFAEKQADFVFAETDGKTYPLYTSSNKLTGSFSLSKTKNYEYSLAESLSVPDNYSLEIAYNIHNVEDSIQDDNGAEKVAAESGYQIVVRIDNDSGWILPCDLDFLSFKKDDKSIRYAIPLRTTRIKKISFEISGVKKADTEMRMESLRLAERFYGFDVEDDELLTSPFVKRESGAEETGAVISISPGENYEIDGERLLFIDGIKEEPAINAGGYTFRYIANRSGGGGSLTVPAVFLREGGGVQIKGSVDMALLKSAPPQSQFEPVTADPGFILLYPQDDWRNENYEVFRWESFPDILIFDTVSYDFQDKLFKRAAFFAEKKGFRGRLAKDEEIAELHAWNAHDYNAETLARFFDAAKKSSFPLLDEEIELRRILVETNIIKDSGGEITAGSGAVISISRESAGYQRFLFMTHEAFHGLFFIDADFREFSRQRWDKLDKEAKQFIISFFDFQQYDINDSFLMVNEFMGHCLQQGVSDSGRYFGETLANRLYERSVWRRASMPPRDEASGAWPGLTESFRNEEAAFSNYVSARWGLAAGRVWRVRL
jgi:hypothetical protein